MSSRKTEHIVHVSGFVPDPQRTILKSMEERNTCPACGSNFLVVVSYGLPACSRLEVILKCCDCGKELAHIYRLVYAFSELMEDEEAQRV